MSSDLLFMDDGEFLAYVNTHCDTPRALFTKAQAERLYRLAGLEVPNVLANSSAGWLAMPRRDINEILRMARERVKRAEVAGSPDEMLPADIVATKGWWCTCVLLKKRVGAFPGSIDNAPGFPSVAGLGDMLRLSDSLAYAVKAMKAPEALVLVEFRHGAIGYELDAPEWLVSIDDDLITIAEWFGANREGLDAVTLQAVVNLSPGEVYEGGGGAAPVWKVRRLP